MRKRNSRIFLVCTMFFAMLCTTVFPPMTMAEDPVKIGYFLSMSGVYAALGEDLKDGLYLYLDEIKFKAGNRDIQVVVENISSSQVTLALDATYNAIQKHKIDIIAGIVDSAVALAMAKLAEKNQLPMIVSCAGADDLTQRLSSPWIARPAFGSSAGSHAMGAWAYEQGFRKAVVIGPSNPAGFEQIGGMCRTFSDMGGKIVQEFWPSLGTQDFKPILEKVNTEADVMFVFFAGGDAQRFVTQYAESGLKGKIPIVGRGFLVDEKILEKVGAAAEGIVTESHWSVALDTPENRAFKAAYLKKYGRNPTLYSELGYTTGMAIAGALNKTKGQVKGKNFVAALRSLELNAPRGVVKFDEFGAPIQTSFIRRVEKVNGEWQNVVRKTYPAVNQFWKWTPEEYMKMPTYAEMKGKWAE